MQGIKIAGLLLIGFIAMLSSCENGSPGNEPSAASQNSITVSYCKYGADLTSKWNVGDIIYAMKLDASDNVVESSKCEFVSKVLGNSAATFVTNSDNAPKVGERWIFWKGKSAKYSSTNKRFDVNYDNNENFMSFQDMSDFDFMIDTVTITNNMNLAFNPQSVVCQIKGLPADINKITINSNKDWFQTSFCVPSKDTHTQSILTITSSSASAYAQNVYVLLKPVSGGISGIELTISGYRQSNTSPVFSRSCTLSSVESGDVIDVVLSDAVSKYMRTPYNSGEYVKLDNFSNEFEGNVIDTQHWENPISNSFATWTFQPENVSQHDGKLYLSMKYNNHTRTTAGTTQNLYFDSGMLRAKEKVGYGYYEARIKGAPVWPGTCSSFWLYTFPADCKNILPRAENTVVYNEIDVIELQQVPSNIDILSTNIHIWVLDKDLKNKQIKAGQYPTLGKSETVVNGVNGGRFEFHTYAVENRPDSIVFYFDQRRIASKPNYFWHMDMYLTLSLGLRTPYEKYEGTDRNAVETTEAQAKAAGFPCSMEVEYIRSWKRDYSGFPSSKKAFNEADFK